jgi:hypothetical protein
MITSDAVSAPLLPHHRRVKPRHTATHDFAVALSRGHRQVEGWMGERESIP